MTLLQVDTEIIIRASAMVRDEDEMSGIFSDGDGVKLCVCMFFLLFFFKSFLRFSY